MSLVIYGLGLTHKHTHTQSTHTYPYANKFKKAVMPAGASSVYTKLLHL